MAQKQENVSFMSFVFAKVNFGLVDCRVECFAHTVATKKVRVQITREVDRGFVKDFPVVLDAYNKVSILLLKDFPNLLRVACLQNNQIQHCMRRAKLLF